MVGSSFNAHAQQASSSASQQDSDSTLTSHHRAASTTSNAASGSGQQAAVSGTVADVVVRSQKNVSQQQAKAYQQTPVSASVVTQEYLENNQINDVIKAARSVPGVGFVYTNLIDQQVNIRGIGNSSANLSFGIPSGTGIYVDGVFQPYPGAWSADIPDLVGVDVLKGPQGTLGGFDSTGGNIYVNTALPSFVAQEKAEISTGSYDLIRAKASATGSLFGSDWAAFRLSFFSEDSKGYVRSVANPAFTYNDVHDKSGRVQLLLTPSNDLTIRLLASYQDVSTHVGRPADGVITNYANGQPYPKSGLSLYQRFALLGVTPYVDGFSSYTTAVNSAYPEEGNDNWVASADVKYKLSNGFILSSLSAFNEYDFSYHGYHDPTLNLNTTLNSGLQPFIARSVQEDVSISTPENKLVDAKAGIFYYYTQDYVWTSGLTGPDNGAYNGSPSYSSTLNDLALNYVATHAYMDLESNSIGPYLHTVWHATNQLDVTAGVRYSYTDRPGYIRGQVFGQDLSSLTPAQQAQALAERTANAGGSLNWNYRVHTRESDGSGTISLSYKITPDIMPYATYSRGVRPGGPNMISPAYLPAGASLTIKPEQLDNYELGIKSQFFGGRIVTAFDGYWESDRNYITQIETFNSAGAALSYMANAPRVTSRGFEGDIRAYPVDGVSLQAAGAYDNAYYNSFPSSPCPPELGNVATTCDFTGRSVEFVPRWSFLLGADFKHPLGVQIPYLRRDLVGFIGANYNWQSSIYTNANDSIYSQVPAYGLLNIHAGLESADEKYKLTVWVNNATDVHYYTNVAAGTAGLISGTVGAPLTAGVTFDATW